MCVHIHVVSRPDHAGWVRSRQAGDKSETEIEAMGPPPQRRVAVKTNTTENTTKASGCEDKYYRT